MNTPADATAVVIDTNVALDLLVFDDPAAQPLRQAFLPCQLVHISVNRTLIRGRLVLAVLAAGLLSLCRATI